MVVKLLKALKLLQMPLFISFVIINHTIMPENLFCDGSLVNVPFDWLPVVKNLPANAGDMGSIPDLGRFHMLWDN